jgi:hypothetical protein
MMRCARRHARRSNCHSGRLVRTRVSLCHVGECLSYP